MNASLTPLPWWPKKPGLTFEPALKPRAGLEDRGHPKWWGAQSGLPLCYSLPRHLILSFSSSCSGCNELGYNVEIELPVPAWPPENRFSWSIRLSGICMPKC